MLKKQKTFLIRDKVRAKLLKDTRYLVKKNIRINIFMLNKKYKIYNGLHYVRKTSCIYDINSLVGQYVFTRRLYQKSLKFFKFKY